MTYSQSESDFSFAINSVSDFDSGSEFGSNSEPDSEPESDFSSAFMNLDIPLNKLADVCFYLFSKQNQ